MRSLPLGISIPQLSHFTFSLLCAKSDQCETQSKVMIEVMFPSGGKIVVTKVVMRW